MRKLTFIEAFLLAGLIGYISAEMLRAGGVDIGLWEVGALVVAYAGGQIIGEFR